MGGVLRTLQGNLQGTVQIIIRVIVIGIGWGVVSRVVVAFIMVIGCG